MKVVWTQGALFNLYEQLEYIAEDNPSAASRMGFAIESQTDLLADFPQMGRIGRIVGTRELVVSGTPYIVIYKAGMESVEIIRLLHGAQDWP